MSEAELRQELVEVKKDNQRLKKELEQTQAELREWEHNAILLSPEEIFAFSRQYRDKKAKECRERDAKAIAEIDKLMVSVALLKEVKSDDERV